MVVLLVFACGCGGDGGESTGAPDTTTKESAPTTDLSKEAGNFRGPNGGNTQAVFGHEASRAERARASRIIEGWMRARASTDWAADCSYFSRRYRHALVAEDATQVSNGEVQNCPQALAFFGIAASGDYKNTLSGPIDRFRVAGGQGIALYHGNDGNNWAVLMEKEAGKWWVAVAAPQELE
ncbi:MAG TPA: hypothetical protein VF125_05720 [Solirubrobacterales bacterium]